MASSNDNLRLAPEEGCSYRSLHRGHSASAGAGREIEIVMSKFLAAILVLGHCCVSFALPGAGTPAPSIRLSQLLQAQPGQQTSWSAFRGKIVVLEFWATWCSPCVANIPHLNEVARSVDPAKVVFLSIDDEAPATVQTFLKGHKMEGWVGIDAPGAKTFSAFGVESRPTTIVVDRSGHIAEVTRAETLTAKDLMALAAKKTATVLAPAAPADHAAKTPPVKPAAAATPPVGEHFEHPSGFKLAFAPAKKYEGDIIHWDEGYTLRGLPAREFITRAWGVPSVRFVSDKPLPDGYFTLDAYAAHVPDEVSNDMIQASICETLGIKVERTKMPREVYVLKATDAAAKQLHPSDPGSAKNVAFVSGKLYLVHGSMDDLASQMEGLFGTPVVNETGLPGAYDFNLTYPDHDGEAARTALRAAGFEVQKEQRTIDVLKISSLR